MEVAGVLFLGLDPTHGPYIYYQYPPDVAKPTSFHVPSRWSKLDTTTSSSPTAGNMRGGVGSGLGKSPSVDSSDDGLASSRFHVQAQDDPLSPNEASSCSTEGAAVAAGGFGRLCADYIDDSCCSAGELVQALDRRHNVFATIKNFAEIFLPRTEMTNRVCWLYEADTDHMILYCAEEFSGLHYTRNIMRFTVAVVFQLMDRLLTPSDKMVTEILQSHSVALLHIVEAFKEAEERHSYLFHHLDPQGSFYDPMRPLRSTIRPKKSTQASTARHGTIDVGIDVANATPPSAAKTDHVVDGRAPVTLRRMKHVHTNAMSGGGGGGTGSGLTGASPPSLSTSDVPNAFFGDGWWPSCALPTSSQSIPDGDGVLWYDVCCVMDHAYDCLVGATDTIPLSLRSSITICWPSQSRKGQYLYPDDVLVPIASSVDVLASLGEECSWGDLGLTDIFFAIDGIRTVDEIVERFTRRPLSGAVRRLLDQLREEEQEDESIRAGCRRGATSAAGGRWPDSRNGVLAGSMDDVASSVLLRDDDNFHYGMPTRIEAAPSLAPLEQERDVVIALEAVQHLIHANFVRVLTPVRSGHVYVTTPQWYLVLGQHDHPARRALGLHMLAIEEAVSIRAEAEAALAHPAADDAPHNAATPSSLSRRVPADDRSPRRDVEVSREGLQGGEGDDASAGDDDDTDPSLPDGYLEEEPRRRMTPTSWGNGDATRGSAVRCESPMTSSLHAKRSQSPQRLSIDSAEDRRRIGALLNQAAQRGVPSLEATLQVANNIDFGSGGGSVDPPQTPCPCGTASPQSQRRLELSISAALSAISKFQYTSTESVWRHLRNSTTNCGWGRMFHHWCPESMVGLVEFAVLNNWLRQCPPVMSQVAVR